jgi:hypothetical protein
MDDHRPCSAGESADSLTDKASDAIVFSPRIAAEDAYHYVRTADSLDLF